MVNRQFILSIDQSTSGTKALLFNENAQIIARCDKAHRQIINEHNWVEHDPNEIYTNVITTVRDVIEKAGISPDMVVSAAISNQRETGLMWDTSGKPIYNAIVWQCGRGKDICDLLAQNGHSKVIKEKTGLNLSPFFTASKFSWIMQNVSNAKTLAKQGKLLCGTMDSFLIYKLTGLSHIHKTDYSNASRTQLFNIDNLQWDLDLCEIFSIPKSTLPEVCYSDSNFGKSTFEGIFKEPIPIIGVLGDSHAALFAQGCTNSGMAKVTYGTGSSVMMNTGDVRVKNDFIVTSLAWGIDGKVSYVLEGNINDAGSVINWLVNDLEMLSSPKQAQEIAKQVDSNGGVYLVPAFNGLGAPHWDNNAKAIICGMTRGVKKAHIIRAAEESIAYQVKDIIEEINRSTIKLIEIRADGGPTKDSFLMQFQSDILETPVFTSKTEELSGAGAAFISGLKSGLYTKQGIADSREVNIYTPKMDSDVVAKLYLEWKKAIKLTNTN